MFNLTDMGNAERLVARHGTELRYVAEWGWMVWDGKRMRRDISKDANLVTDLAKETVRAMGEEAAQEENSEIRRAILAHALASEATYRIKAMVTLAQSDPSIRADVEDFDCNPLLFNVENGTVDLSTGRLLPHRKEDLITRIAHVAYDEQATSDVFQAWLLEIFNGDAALVEYVQRVLGYGLTGFTNEHKVFIPYGTGRNGKSTLFNLYEAIAGEYASTAEPSLILKQNENSKKSFDMAPLSGARVLLISEPESGKKLEVGRIKQMSGGDSISAEYKYGTRFSFKPKFKIFLYTNHKPEVDEQTDAIWQRLRLIPFDVSFAGREDIGLEARLREHLPAILTWMVKGAVMWQADGLKEPESVTLASKEYKDEEDVLADFINARIIVDKQGVVRAKDVYKEYLSFMEANEDSDVALSEKAFVKQIEQRGYKKKRMNTGMAFMGLRVGASAVVQAERHLASVRAFDDDEEV